MTTRTGASSVDADRTQLVLCSPDPAGTRPRRLNHAAGAPRARHVTYDGVCAARSATCRLGPAASGIADVYGSDGWVRVTTAWNDPEYSEP